MRLSLPTTAQVFIPSKRRGHERGTTLGRNILPLERKGLIRIAPVASDRRAKELHLTKVGEKRLEAARKRWSVAQARFEANFGAMRAADLRASLRAIVASEMAPTKKNRQDR
jgi:DNA-binding MarR family transcriptional regulator